MYWFWIIDKGDEIQCEDSDYLPHMMYPQDSDCNIISLQLYVSKQFG